MPELLEALPAEGLSPKRPVLPRAWSATLGDYLTLTKPRIMSLLRPDRSRRDTAARGPARSRSFAS